MEGSDSTAAPGRRRVLYRCPTPTDLLCPCGGVSRRLRSLGLEHETRRVPYRRKDRPEIVELTRQPYVPVLIDGDEVISDSRRILEYLEYAYGEGAASTGAPEPQQDAGGGTNSAGREDSLYNEKR